MSELPPGWASCCLADMGGTIGGKTPNKATARYWTPPEIPWASPKDMKVFLLRETEDKISNFATTDAGMRVLPTGSVLMVTRSGILAHTFPVAITQMPMAINQDIKAVLPNNVVTPSYLAYALRRQERDVLNSCTKEGTTVASVETQLLENLPLPLAPLPEQKRIADKLDTLLARVDACRAHLDRVPLILKRFRQSVLAAATSGELTREWREERGDTGEAQSFQLEDADSIRDFSFPASWDARRLADIATIAGGVTKDSKKQAAEFPELPYLRVANVQRGYLDLSEVKTIRVPPDRVSDLLLRSGDILFNEGGDIDKLGRGWVWNDEVPACVFQNHVFRARLLNPAFQPRYFSWYGNSRGYEYFLARGKQTTNLASINKSVLAALPVAVPPPNEQDEIVRRVNELFVFADRLESNWKNAVAEVASLTPSTLAKAFRGELVQQDPSDQSAALLSRARDASSLISKTSLAKSVQKRISANPKTRKHSHGQR